MSTADPVDRRQFEPDTAGNTHEPYHEPQPDGPDFGEPWRAIGRTVFGRNKGFVASTNSPEDSARIVACVNACAGMSDPVAKITEMQTELGKQKDEIEQLQLIKASAGKSDQFLLLQAQQLVDAKAEIEQLRVALQTERDDHDADNKVCAACISAAAVRRGWRWRAGSVGEEGGHR